MAAPLCKRPQRVPFGAFFGWFCAYFSPSVERWGGTKEQTPAGYEHLRVSGQTADLRLAQADSAARPRPRSRDRTGAGTTSPHRPPNPDRTIRTGARYASKRPRSHGEESRDFDRRPFLIR